MEKTNIKEMTKEQRFTHLVMLVNTYKNLMVYDIASGNEVGERMWKKDFQSSIKILQGFLKMRGSEIPWEVYIR